MKLPKRKTVLEVVVGLAILSAFPTYVIVTGTIGINAITPRDETSVGAYLDELPMPGRVERLALPEGQFFICYGPLHEGVWVPSGPPSYVFDESGTHVRC